MTDRASGLAIFEHLDPRYIGSLNHVLGCLNDGPLEREPVRRSLVMNSGVSGHLVDIKGCLAFCEELNLIVDRDGRLSLSPLGSRMLRAGESPPYNQLNHEQGSMLLAALLEREEIAEIVSKLARRMHRRSDGSLAVIPTSSQLTKSEIQCLHALQSVRGMAFEDGVISMPRATYDMIVDIVGTPAAVTEEELWKILDLQRKRGVKAELFVREFEARRLTSNGRPDLADLVERVSEYDVNAGFDIRSFEPDGSDRFIEVKSSTGTDVRFFLTRNEKRFMQERNETAWLYFVSRVHQLSPSTSMIIAIPTPLKILDRFAVIEEQESLVTIPRSVLREAVTTNDVLEFSACDI